MPHVTHNTPHSKACRDQDRCKIRFVRGYDIDFAAHLVLRNPEDGDLLLLEVPPILLIDEYQIQIIPCAELLVDIPERWCQFESSQEQPDWNRLSANWGAVHDFELGDGLGFVILIWCCSGCFSTDDGEFHVFNFDSDEEKVDFAHDDVFEMVSASTRGTGKSC